jgi:diadenosine tetraphosphatase ApaH/serine/threonine PP2A family protein phosphatase
MTRFGESIEAVGDLDLREALRGNVHIKDIVLLNLLRKLQELLVLESNVLYLSTSPGQIIVCGDIHGQMLDLFRLLDTASQGLDFDTSDDRYLFLGDYVDRGYSSFETFAYLAYLKVRHPKRIWLLRGNHESRTVNQQYGLYNDCDQVYGNPGLWIAMNDTFDFLPVAAVIDDRLFCVHGGLSHSLSLVGQIHKLDRVQEIDDGPIGDLTWSDPDEMAADWSRNSRGKGYIFGPRPSRIWLRNNRLDAAGRVPKEDPRHAMIVRSHQMVEAGFQWMHDDALLIVWSAPNYAYRNKNAAVVLRVRQGEPDTIIPFKEDDRSPIKPENLTIAYFA